MLLHSMYFRVLLIDLPSLVVLSIAKTSMTYERLVIPVLAQIALLSVIMLHPASILKLYLVML
jgi:hypothetical protein